MKSLVVAGIVLVLLGGGATAQGASMTGAPPDPEAQGESRPPVPPAGRAGEWARGEPGGSMQARRFMPSPPTKAAAFRVESGDIYVGMKCPEDEPLKACADFTFQLLDKLSSLPKH